MTSAMTDCSCGCSRDTVSPAPLDPKEKRDGPPQDRKYVFDDFEMAPTETNDILMDDSGVIETASPSKRAMLQRCNLPSGLSVEAEESGLEQSTH